ncbi:MAG: hypothetical protein A2Z21_02960 [Candidatus Fraserbacteria bacterium RBG_16_55_9]|uniref:Uncharacterized protein n=1 Tax=Fraserbacteria sp. (strain RBG_16_55_9) TaxID=1817864 RepID=A0A1F5UTY4_FRAXR|nr:MAG: hypothetical protein A2Z21_02960 [Candidatus Fraserbacteria bacterium RBG_16_55_9]
MKKLGVILGALGVLALVLAFSIPQIVNSQMAQSPTAQPAVDRMQLQMEIGLHRLINEMGLSRDQVASFKEMVSDLRTSEQAILQAQQELRDFLASYNGNRDDFAEAVKPFDDKVAQAREVFQEKLRTSIEKAKDLLTLKQAEILREFIAQHLGRQQTQTARPFQGMMAPAEPDHKLELRINLKTPSKTEFLDRFKDHVEEWLDHFGINLDRENSQQMGNMLQGHGQMQNEQSMMSQMPPAMSCERPAGSMLHMMICGRSGLTEHPFVGSFLIAHLDLLEKVLSEKLEQMGSTHI